MQLSAAEVLPDDPAAILLGRAWVPGPVPGPSPVGVHAGQVYDLSRLAPTVAQLLDLPEPALAVKRTLLAGAAPSLGNLQAVLDNSQESRRDPSLAWLLAPVDLQAVRACGVTFIASMLERVIEEQAKGDPQQADALRHTLGREMGAELANLRPGSAEALRLKEALLRRGAWSQYLEVGIGADAEVFNKAQPLSAVGLGADIGILARSRWNNPEPELVLVIDRQGRIIGATLGNDVNLRDFEGRSALLLGRAKDNNASCALGPFLRLFDEGFGLDHLRRARIEIRVDGSEGFRVRGEYGLDQISRDPAELAAHALDAHQYPDGLVLFLGTAFAPVQDRGEPGHGFTHQVGDLVSIRCSLLGMLVNRVQHCERIAAWQFGLGDLLRNLSARGLLGAAG